MSKALKAEKASPVKLLQALPQSDIDAITTLASQICETPGALLTLISEDEVYYRACELDDIVNIPINHTFCNYTLKSSNNVFIVEDAHKDDRFKNNPLVTGKPYIRFYAGIALTSYDGTKLGSLCVLDDKPKTLTDQQINSLNLLAKQAMNLIELRMRRDELQHTVENLDKTQIKLQQAKQEADFRVKKMEFLSNSIKVGIFEKSIIEGTETWSNHLYKILGFKKSEIEATIKNLLSRVHPADKMLLKRAISAAGKKENHAPVEIRVLTKKGEYRWVEVTGNVRREKGKIILLVGRVIDIHKKKVIKNQLSAFIEYTPATVAMFNRHMEFITVSKKWREDYHAPGGMILGRKIYDTFPTMDVEKWKKIYERCLKGAIEYSNEESFGRTNGEGKIWLKWEVRPWFISDDEIGGVLVLTEDITTLKERNLQLLKAKEEAERATEEAEKATKAKAQFLATMSHEIRTPLNAINGLSHLLMSENPRPDQLEHLKLLKFSGDNLLNLVNDILDINKIESNKLKLEQNVFGLHELIKNIQNSLFQKADENLVTIRTNYDEKLPTHFIGDITRISQIIYNLVGNAVKFTTDGYVDISVKYLEQKDGKYGMKFSVKDSGIGIAPENQSKIFESFEQAETGTTRKYGGTGLGLYITRKLLNMMGSDIKIYSRLGEGSEFYFDLYLEEGQPTVSELYNDITLEDIRKKDLHVLVAEDNTANQILIGKFLKRANVTYEMANNGMEALNLVSTKRFDMILMDLRMPEVNGYEATAKIRLSHDPYFRSIPIIALTADALAEVKDEVFKLGMDGYLSKPFRPAELYKTLYKFSERVNGKVMNEMINTDESRIADVINIYADGDKDFIMDFANNCIKNYEEFLKDFNGAIKTSDEKRLKDAIHKITSLNKVFEQEELASILREINQMEGTASINGLHRKVIENCDKILAELTSIAHY
ncbi:ATP-binding protein [Fulvivirga ligni]|uniref:ATP-binding protein n=1 Tax=Fulvivirga ligni TaxID=2904246 RepID=UPI001F30B7FD|nr:ATP-binding protein [Fulvivirga ligni]UII19444.1 ATP-binding protein [Fulvivirga ligni]